MEIKNNKLNSKFKGARVHPNAYVDSSAELHDGVSIASGAIIGPNVIIESLTLNVPIISTYYKSGLTEIIFNGKGGDLIKNNDPSKIAKRILLFFSKKSFLMKKTVLSQKKLQRFKVAKKTVVSTSKPLFYVNQVGGQDELVFDGNSFLMNSKGQILDNMLPWKEQVKTYSYVKKDNTFNE